MKPLERANVVLQLGQALKRNGSWTGETHVQKAGYFLQQLLRVPTDFEYILYKHGPFSFELREQLTSMQAENFIRWAPQPPYGPTLEPGSLSEELNQQFGDTANLYTAQIAFVAAKLGSKSVAELERIATALYVTTEEKRLGNDRSTRIIELKPHIRPEQAQKAVKEFDEIAEAANQQGLVVH
jgi:uncharacterized protein YwgA